MADECVRCLHDIAACFRYYKELKEVDIMDEDTYLKWCTSKFKEFKDLEHPWSAKAAAYKMLLQQAADANAAVPDELKYMCKQHILTQGI